MKKRLPALFLALALALSSGCAGPAKELRSAAGGGKPLTGVPSAPADRAVAHFGAELLAAAHTEGENTLVSPLSVALALSMAAEGAAGETLDQLLAALGDGCTTEELRGNCASLLADYDVLGGDTTLALADSLWIDKDWAVADDFLARCVDGYRAGVFAADFEQERAVDAVNKWVEEHTGGNIKDMLEELPRDTALLLVNALYLKAKWALPFAKEGTRTADFYPATGGTVKTDFMSDGAEPRRYIDTGRETGVVLPYNDGRLGFLAVMPKEGGLSAYLSDWDLGGLLAGAEERQVRLSMPKFELRRGGELIPALRELGITDLFVPGAADLSALSPTGQKELFVDKVYHDAFIRVDEAGTEAAAATVVVAVPSSAPMPLECVTLTLDRPFVYAVVDLERGVPLLMGTYETP